LKKLVSLLLVAACGLASLPACAGQVTIDFEHTPGPDGKLGTADDVPMPNAFLQSLRDQFAPLGLTFTQGSLLQTSFFDGNASNHFISSTLPVALLSMPLTGIGIESYSYWNATLVAYGIDGQVVASDRLLNPTNGSAFYRGELSVTSSQPIYGFAVTADDPNYILNLDNLVLTSADATSAVPEPTDSALFALGLSLAGLSLRARGRKRG
jgi:hypothetical protein